MKSRKIGNEENKPRIISLSEDETSQWRGQEFSNKTIIEGLDNILAFEFGWRMKAITEAPPTNTLEKRSSKLADKEAMSIGRYYGREYNLNKVTLGTWYELTNDKRPGEIFYAYSKGLFSAVQIYRKIK